MPKAKIATETTEVLQQAQAAANEPQPPPAENAAVYPIVEPIHEDIDPHAQIKAKLADLDQERIELRNTIQAHEDLVKTLKISLKELDKQHLDLLKNAPTLYKEVLQSRFNF